MKALILALTLTALTGCATMQRYPKTTTFIASSLLLSAGLAYRNHGDSAPIEEPRMSTPLVNCAEVSCK